MSIFTEIEQLIDERGSTEALKERILALKKKHAAFVSENIAHKTKIAELGTQVRQLKKEITKLKEINENLKSDIHQLATKIDRIYNFGAKDLVCEHCGSNRLKEAGKKPNKRTEKLGANVTVFRCEDCGKETVVRSEQSRANTPEHC